MDPEEDKILLCLAALVCQQFLPIRLWRCEKFSFDLKVYKPLNPTVAGTFQRDSQIIL